MNDSSAAINGPSVLRTRRERVDGRLHEVHEVHAPDGRILSSIHRPLKVEFHLEDAAQLLAGSCVMALPVALTGEVWDLGALLSPGRTVMILVLSVFTLAGFIWALFYGRRAGEFRLHFLARGVSAYLIPFAVSFALLWLFEKAPLDDLPVALTRTIIVAFPASFAATAVDFMK